VTFSIEFLRLFEYLLRYLRIEFFDLIEKPIACFFDFWNFEEPRSVRASLRVLV
jgi:hypothetical protein